jgi:putative phage-type endonuclease
MLKEHEIPLEYIQGTAEWLALRKTKITATDANSIMNCNPWKNKKKLYLEKISEENNTFVNAAMQRGLDLEPIARELFTIKTGIEVFPKVIVKDWMMASLDGISACGKYVVEIKCPGDKDHKIALSGKVPDHYYAQLQHQMYVAGVKKMCYFSFDGTDEAMIEVNINTQYVEQMIEEERKFYTCITNKIPPDDQKKEYKIREDDFWQAGYLELKMIADEMLQLEKRGKELKESLISSANHEDTKGCGLSICKVKRKGNIDYSAIPELEKVDLEKYRKPAIEMWKVCLE